MAILKIDTEAVTNEVDVIQKALISTRQIVDAEIERIGTKAFQDNDFISFVIEYFYSTPSIKCTLGSYARIYTLKNVPHTGIRLKKAFWDEVERIILNSRELGIPAKNITNICGGYLMGRFQLVNKNNYDNT